MLEADYYHYYHHCNSRLDPSEPTLPAPYYDHPSKTNRIPQAVGFGWPAPYNPYPYLSSSQMPQPPHQFLASAPPVPAHYYPLAGSGRNVSAGSSVTYQDSNNTACPPRSSRTKHSRSYPRRAPSLASSNSTHSRSSGNSRVSKHRGRTKCSSRGSTTLTASGSHSRPSAHVPEGPSVGILPKLGNLLLGQQSQSSAIKRPSKERQHRTGSSTTPSKHYKRSTATNPPGSSNSRRRRGSLNSLSQMSLTSAMTGKTSSSSGSNSTVTPSRLRRAKTSIALEPHQESESERSAADSKERKNSNSSVNVFDYLDQGNSPPETETLEDEWSSSEEGSDEEEEDDDANQPEEDNASEGVSTRPTSLSSSPANSFKAQTRDIVAPRPISYAGVHRRTSLHSNESSEGSPRSNSAQLRAHMHHQLARPYSHHAGDPDIALELYHQHHTQARPHVPGHFPSMTALREELHHRPSTGDIGSGSSTYLSSRSSSTRRRQQDYDLLARKLSSTATENGQDSLIPVYRGFEFLHHRVLQHLQSELILLEDELASLDRDGDEVNLKPAIDVEYRKTELLGRVYMKMDQYRNALNGYKTFTKELDTATSNDVATHRQWIESHSERLGPRTARYLDTEDDLVKVCRSSRRSSQEHSIADVASSPAQNATSTLVFASIAFAIFLSFLSVFGSLSFGTAMTLLLYHCGVMVVTACMGVTGLRETTSTWLDAYQLKDTLRSYLTNNTPQPPRKSLKSP